jgi:hypothetical protein
VTPKFTRSDRRLYLALLDGSAHAADLRFK